MYIYGHVACNVAVMKGKGVATLMPSKGFPSELCQTDCEENDDVAFTENEHDRRHGESDNPPHNTTSLLPPLTPQSPCWYPLSWRTGFPRAFSLSELEVLTNGFANENVVLVKENRIIYEAIYQETPVIISCYSGNDDQVWSLFKILSQVRHRNIMNLVGYCSTGDSLSLLCDYPCSGTLEMNLKCKATSLAFEF